MAKRQAALLRATIEAGQVKWRGLDAKRWQALKIHLEGKEVDITIDRHAAQRSGKQNKYYHGVVVAMFAEAAGYEHEEAHDALRWHFLKVHEEELPTVRSTASLTTAEFEEYMTQCRRLGAQMFGLYIPLPGEVSGD